MYNSFYKHIAEVLSGNTYTTSHSDNYYLNVIATHYCQRTYTGTVCNGVYLHDIAAELNDTTISGNHFNNFYLYRIVHSFNSGVATGLSDEEYLTLFAYYVDEGNVDIDTLTLSAQNNIIQSGGSSDLVVHATGDGVNVPFGRYYLFEIYTESLSLSSNKSMIQSNSNAIVSALLKDEDGSLVENETVYFFEQYNPVLSLSSNTSILQSGGNAILTNVLKDEDGSLVEDETVYFFEQYTPLLNISADTVDEFDTGTATVKLTDNDDGSLVEGETVTGYLYNPHLFYYKGTGGTETDSWNYNSTYISYSSDSTGTTVTNSDTQNRRVYGANLNGTSSSLYDYIGDCTVEFDIVSVTGNLRIFLEGANSPVNRYDSSNLSTGHYKIIYEDNTVTLYKDNVLVRSSSFTPNGFYEIIFVIGTSSSFKFKNFNIGGY